MIDGQLIDFPQLLFAGDRTYRILWAVDDEQPGLVGNQWLNIFGPHLKCVLASKWIRYRHSAAHLDRRQISRKASRKPGVGNQHFLTGISQAKDYVKNCYVRARVSPIPD
jgi:hypothetical protein